MAFEKELTLPNEDRLVFKDLTKDKLDTGFMMKLMDIPGLFDGQRMSAVFELFPLLCDKVELKSGVKTTPNLAYVQKLDWKDGQEVMNKLVEMVAFLKS